MREGGRREGDGAPPVLLQPGGPSFLRSESPHSVGSGRAWLWAEPPLAGPSLLSREVYVSFRCRMGASQGQACFCLEFIPGAATASPFWLLSLHRNGSSWATQGHRARGLTSPGPMCPRHFTFTSLSVLPLLA